MNVDEKCKNDAGGNESKKNKRHRKRFKSLYGPIVRQMEFYFGDANLSKSKFMVEEMENEGAESRFIALGKKMCICVAVAMAVTVFF